MTGIPEFGNLLGRAQISCVGSPVLQKPSAVNQMAKMRRLPTQRLHFVIASPPTAPGAQDSTGAAEEEAATRPSCRQSAPRSLHW